MNITIKINDDKEIIMQPEKENQSIKKRTRKKPVSVWEYELANHLLQNGFMMKKIYYRDNGFLFSFYNTEDIKNEMKKWSRIRHSQMLDSEDEIIIENEKQNEEGDIN